MSLEEVSPNNKQTVGKDDMPAKGDLVLTIRDAEQVVYPGKDGKPDQKKDALVFYETEKKFPLNSTNKDTLRNLYGQPVAWKDKAIALYFDKSVSFGGQKIGGMRIREELPA